ncbi:MAG TPA: hypothetical protein VIC08_03465 [Cellvibrionaceae bacterium]
MRIFTLLLCLTLNGCHFFAEPLEASSEHFHIVADTYTSSEAEMQSLLEQGEAFHAGIAAIYPLDIPLDPVIEVRLNGDARGKTPFVDGEGTIHLWRYLPEEGGYGAIFAHEIAHAIAFDYWVEAGALEWPDLGFYNEGWAEYAALMVDSGKTGFPLYGFDEDVVAGHWVEHGGLSLAALRTAHEALNQRCEFQAYLMRASWFRYIDEIFGRKVLQNLVAAREGLTPDAVEAVLGESLDKVDANWRSWVSARYAAHPNADAEAAAYRARIGGYVPCVE